MRSPFWGMIAAVIGVSLPFVVLWRRHVALKATRYWITRPITSDEIVRLRWLGRLSIWLFVVFWIVALGLIVGVTLSDAPLNIQRMVFIGILVMAATGIGFHLSIQCPICNFRLGYQRTIGIPSRCERCGATFR